MAEKAGLTIVGTEPPENIVRAYRAEGIEPPKAYEVAIDSMEDFPPFTVFLAREPIGKNGKGEPDERWHISVAHEEVLCPWQILVEIVHHLRPGVAFAIPLPSKSHWVNLHPNALHAWEVHDPNVEAQWKAEADTLKALAKQAAQEAGQDVTKPSGARKVKQTKGGLVLP